MDMSHTGIEVRRPRVRSASFRALEKASRAEGYWMLTRLLFCKQKTAYGITR